MTPAALAGLGLALVLVTIEWRRADRANLALRLGLVLLTSAALVLLAEPDAWTAPAESGDLAPAAITGLDAPTEVAVGEALPVRGRATLSDADSAWVILSDPAGAIDSVRVTRARPDFRLTARPRAAGSALYHVMLGGAGAAVADSFGVAVRAAQPPALLVLNGSPDFETAYLKRWLAGRGAVVTLRSTLTRGRSRIERLNGAPDAEGALTPGLLQRFDAVLLDSAAFASLSSGESRTLTAAVREDGLGLLLTGPAAPSPLLAGFTLQPTDSATALDRRVAHPSWRGMPRRSRTGIEVAPAALRHRSGLDPLVLDETGSWLAAAQSTGAGRIAISLVRTPSRWQLDGDADLFAGYWSLLLSAVARDTTADVRLEGPSPRADHRAEISLITTAPHPTLTLRAPDGVTSPVALARDPFDPRRWRGTFWPRTTGWHAFQLAERSVPFLVLPAPRAAAETAGPNRRPRPVSIIAFLLTLLALTLLWAESRRRIGR